MEDSTERELEQFERLEQLRKLVQAILSKHIVLLIVVFLLFLAAFLSIIYLKVSHSPDRFKATIILHYFPKKTNKIQSYDSKYLVQMFNRQALLHKFYKEVNDEFARSKPVANKISIYQERKQDSSIYISLNTMTPKEAIALTNAFAQFCIREYTSERMTDLQKWKDALLQQKQDTFKDIQRINQEKDRLIIPLNVVSPERDYERLRLSLGEQQAALVKLTLVVTNLQTKKERLEEAMAKHNPNILLYEKEIKSYFATLKQIDDEILLNQERYTEENPRMLALLARKQTIKENFDIFLKERKISFDDIEFIETLNRLTRELKEVKGELELKEEEQRLLKTEISSNSERFHVLNEVLPRYQQLSQQSANLMDSVQKVDDSIADINYLLLLVKDDLFVGEQVETAEGEALFDKKSIFIAFFSTVVLTGFFAIFVVMLDFFFGKVTNAKELELYSDFSFLGILPESEKMLENESPEDLTLSAVCHRFQSTGNEHHIVMVGVLPGGTIIKELFENFEWNYAMSGKRILSIDMMSASDFNENTPMEDTCIIAYHDWKGILPVANQRYFSPAEMDLLKRDLEVLRKTYDLIFIRRGEPIKRDRLFLEQMASICDGLLIGVGAQKTLRKSLRALGKIFLKKNKPIMTVLSDSSNRGNSENWED